MSKCKHPTSMMHSITLCSDELFQQTCLTCGASTGYRSSVASAKRAWRDGCTPYTRDPQFVAELAKGVKSCRD